MGKNVGFLARIRYNYLKVHNKLRSQNMVNNSQIVLLIVAGSNGSGKSTIYENFKNTVPEYRNLPLVNPDVITYNIVKEMGFNSINQLSVTEQNIANLKAAKTALTLRKKMIREKTSFAVETTASSRSIIDLADKAKEQGYRIDLLYVTVGSPLMNIKRVHQRVIKGGHNVADADILRRYNRSLLILPELIKRTDTIYVYDNENSPEMIFFKSAEERQFFTKKKLHVDFIKKIFSESN
ncbi:zeta toxin family protein [Succinivibrio dextrinosolvens]|uniref:Predicted ABC-type ATPase n=2 Tax=Succinivibrio TaxID=83770 RepID=A0A662ZEH5_9GAMM|nr:zeta toxin family protein [Succinivibrio dextrinosolvens]SFK46613.1 Predicted ABC-type ATPase [Succinivibrio dextrinosolvens]